MNVSLNKSKLGGIGENMVQTKLMQLGLNVVNANTIIANYEAVDLICSQPGNKKNVGCRINVPAFIKDENGRFVKDGNGNYMKEEIGEAQYNILPEGLQSECFSYSVQ